MGEWQRLHAEVHLAVARLHASDLRGAEALHRLKTQHRPALVATAVLGAAAAAWWGRRRQVRQGLSASRSRSASPRWVPWLIGAVPALMQRVVKPAVPAPWRHWATHPVAVSLVAALVKRLTAPRR